MNTFEIKTIKCFTGIDMGEHNLPIMMLDSNKDGPVLWLFAAIHGNEVNGIEVIHRVFKFLKRTPLKKGKIYALPIANPWGFELKQRENPYDLSDMNRHFPGDAQGNTTERINNIIFKYILSTKPNLLIDLHADTINSIPYIIVDKAGSKTDKEIINKTWEYANKFGVTATEEVEEFTKQGIDKSLSYALINAGIPSFVVELGGPKLISENFARAGVSGIKNILKYLEMIDYPKYWESETKIKTVGKLKLIENITCDESGVTKFLVKPGQKVKKNKPLAKIKDIFGKTKDIVVAPEDCYVISYEDTAISFPGSYLFTLAAEEKIKPQKKEVSPSKTPLVVSPPPNTTTQS
jgi:predicted deacylase